MLTSSRLALWLTILVFTPWIYAPDQFEGPKACVVRVLGIAAIASLVADSIRARRRIGPGSSIQPLDIALLAWFVVEGITSFASCSPRLSLAGDAEQHEGLITSAGLMGLYLAARLGTSATGEALGTCRHVVAVAAVASVYGVMQLLGLDPLPWQGLAIYAHGFVRPISTFGHPNLLGVVSAAACGVATAGIFLDGRRRWWWSGALALVGATTLMTLSRAAWLGAAAAVTVAGIASVFVTDVPWRRVLKYGLIGAGITAVALTIGLATSDVFRSRMHELLAPTEGPSRARLEIWRAALAMWRARPWLGLGPDTFGLFFMRYQTPEYWRYEWSGWQFHAHSIYLHTLATRGVAGFAAATGVGVGLVVAVTRAWRRAAESRRALAALLAALSAMAVAGAFGALGMGGAVLLALLLGTAGSLADPRPGPTPAAAGGSRNAPGSPTGRARARGHGGAARRRVSAGLVPGRVGLVGLLAGAVTLAFHVPGIQASRAALVASEMMPRNAGEAADATARDAANRAVRLAPGSDRLWALRASTLLAYSHAAPTGPTMTPRAAGDLAEAERSAGRAIAIEPARALNHQILGRVLLARAGTGDPRAIESARAEFERCRELAPANALAQLEFSFTAIQLDRADLAIGPARVAEAMYPDEALPHSVAGQASLALGDTLDAIAEFDRALRATWRDVPYSRGELEELRTRLARGR